MKKISASERWAEFYAEAERRRVEMERTGMGIPAEEVFDYLRKRILGEKAVRPKPRKLI